MSSLLFYDQIDRPGLASLNTYVELGGYSMLRKALEIGGPTFLHTFDPCPKGWDYHPRYSHELGELGIRLTAAPAR